jgi:hypothetical protein
MHTGYEAAAANSLVQAAESALPKQKKATAISEFKHLIVAHKRCSKSYYDGGTNLIFWSFWLATGYRLRCRSGTVNFSNNYKIENKTWGKCLSLGLKHLFICSLLLQVSC